MNFKVVIDDNDLITRYVTPFIDMIRIICCNIEYECHVVCHLHIRRITFHRFWSKHSMINQAKSWFQKSFIFTLNAFNAKVSFAHHYLTKMKVEYWCAFIWHFLSLGKWSFLTNDWETRWNAVFSRFSF